MGPGIGSPLIGVVNIKVPKQQMVGRFIRMCSMNKRENLMSVKWEGFTGELVFGECRGEVSCSVHIVDHDVSHSID